MATLKQLGLEPEVSSTTTNSAHTEVLVDIPTALQDATGITILFWTHFNTDNRLFWIDAMSGTTSNPTSVKRSYHTRFWYGGGAAGMYYEHTSAVAIRPHNYGQGNGGNTTGLEKGGFGRLNIYRNCLVDTDTVNFSIHYGFQSSYDGDFFQSVVHGTTNNGENYPNIWKFYGYGATFSYSDIRLYASYE